MFSHGGETWVCVQGLEWSRMAWRSHGPVILRKEEAVCMERGFEVESFRMPPFQKKWPKTVHTLYK